MKNTLLLLTALAFFCTSSLAQKPDAAWVRTITNDGASLITLLDSWIDPQGNVYYLAYHYGTISIEQGPTIQNPDNEERSFLVKYLADGSFAWVIPFGAYTFYNGHLSGDADGNVLLAGTFNRGFIDFGNNVQIHRSCSNCEEIFMVKYQPDGVAQWAKTIKADQNATFDLSGLDSDGAGNLYISGNYDGQKLAFPGDSSYNMPFNTRFFLARLNQQSEPTWVRFLEEESSPAENLALATASDGTCFVLGAYFNTLQFTPAAQLLNYGGFQDDYLAAYSNQGQFLWAKNLNSGSTLGTNDLEADEQGGAYLPLFAFEPVYSGNHPVTPDGPGELGGFLLRIHEDSISVPVMNRHGYWANSVSAVCVGPDGEFYTGGYFYDTLFNTVNGVNLTNSGDGDILLCHGNGDQLFTATSIGGAGYEDISNEHLGNVMGLDQQGNLYISGNFGGVLNLAPFSMPGTGVYFAKLKTGTVQASEVVGLEDFLVSPNPANGAFQIRFDTENPDGSLALYGLDGRELYRTPVTGKLQTIDVEFPAGMYCLQWQGANGQRVIQKICVVR